MNKAIFFYDGDCGFCNAAVRFLLDKTKLASLLFCPLQSTYAEDFFAKHGYQQPDLTTAYLFHNSRLYQKSSAVLKAIALAEGEIRHLSIFLIIPAFIRDGIYNVVASMRKQIQLGKNSCRLLTPQERERFLSL
jgi:predicted DCC family thiol-disulfide oxidoreductase YuxK